MAVFTICSNKIKIFFLSFGIACSLTFCSRSGTDTDNSKPKEDTLFEDFSGPINEGKWGIMSLPYSAGNKESQWYRPQNLIVSEGTLKIIARRDTVTGPAYQAPAMSFVSNDGMMRAAPVEGLPAGTRYWTSGLINTRDAGTPRYFPLFGHYEIKARVPHGQGLLPAFWLRRREGASWGEVDIMEYFGGARPGYSKFSLHFPNTIGKNTTQQSTFFETPVPGTGGWHTWAVEIRPAKEQADSLKDPIEFIAYLDGKQYGYYKLTDAQSIRDLHMISRETGLPMYPNSANETWDICVNMAVGGQWVGQPDQQLGYLPMPNRCSKDQKVPPQNDPSACNVEGLFFAVFPAIFEVDYIKVRLL